jgi:hypothetical protein
VSRRVNKFQLQIAHVNAVAIADRNIQTGHDRFVADDPGIKMFDHTAETPRVIAVTMCDNNVVEPEIVLLNEVRISAGARRRIEYDGNTAVAIGHQVTEIPVSAGVYLVKNHGGILITPARPRKLRIHESPTTEIIGARLPGSSTLSGLRPSGHKTHYSDCGCFTGHGSSVSHDVYAFLRENTSQSRVLTPITPTVLAGCARRGTPIGATRDRRHPEGERTGVAPKPRMLGSCRVVGRPIPRDPRRNAFDQGEDSSNDVEFSRREKRSCCAVRSSS